MGIKYNLKTRRLSRRKLGKVISPLNEKLKNVEWGEFKLGDLFKINPTKYYRLQNEEIINKNGKGFINVLKDKNVDIKNKTVAILGAGGAARAISIMLAKEGIKKIIVFN